MADLTDITNDTIFIYPDATTLTAYNAWYATLKGGEKDNFNLVGDKYIVSIPDPTGVLDDLRKEMISLVDANSELPTSVTRLRHNADGTLSMIINMVAKPEEPE